MGLVDSRPRFCRSLYSVGNSVQWPKLPGYAYLHSALFVAKSGFGLKRVCTLSRKRRRRFILDSIANDKRSDSRFLFHFNPKLFIHLGKRCSR